MEKLNQLEQKIILLETKGVAAIPWRKNIINIVSTIQTELYEKLSSSEDKSYINIYLQNEDTKAIDFIQNLILSIDCYSETLNQKYLHNLDIGGTVITPSDIELTDTHQLPHINIQVGVLYDDNGNIKQGVLCNTLYHELNHLYELYIDLMKNKQSKFHNKSCLIGNTYWGSDDDIFHIIYRLFSTTEVNALVASVYGDLEELNVNYKNYSNKIVQTQAWQEYQFMKNHYQNIVNNLNNDEILQLKLFFQKYNIPLYKYNQNDNFKLHLSKEIQIRLMKLLKKINGVIALYLNNLNENTINKIIHTTLEQYKRKYK